MLTWITIENFRCLRRVDVALRPLTILIGANDSGKSAFLSALHTLAYPDQVRLSDHWRLEKKSAIRVTAKLPDRLIDFSTQRAPKAYKKIDPPAQGPTGDPTVGAVLFQLPACGASMISPGHADEGAPPALQPDGKMVPALLDYLLRRDRKQFEDFVESMRRRVPGLHDIHIATPDPKTRRIDLSIEDGLLISADNASVGIRLLLFFMALRYHPQPPRLILLEEPENGLHPRRLGSVMSLLREVTVGAHCGHPAQVILTTHSPYLLDHADLDQDQVLVFQRAADGSRTAEPVDKERLKEFLDEFMLGEIWFNQEEEGLVERKE